MSDYDALIGRTIVNVGLMPSQYSEQPSEMDGLVLELDNGARVHIRGDGYDDSSATLIDYTAEEWAELVSKAAESSAKYAAAAAARADQPPSPFMGILKAAYADVLVNANRQVFTEDSPGIHAIFPVAPEREEGKL